MEASSIITQVSREDEHLKSFVPDKGKPICLICIFGVNVLYNIIAIIATIVTSFFELLRVLIHHVI